MHFLFTKQICLIVTSYRYQYDIKMISPYNACYSASYVNRWKVNRRLIRLELSWHFGKRQKAKCWKERIYTLFERFGNIWGYIYILSSVGRQPGTPMSPLSQFTPKPNPPNHLLPLSNRVPLKFPSNPSYSPTSTTRKPHVNTNKIPNYLPTK